MPHKKKRKRKQSAPTDALFESAGPSDNSQKSAAVSTGPSCVSMKSDRSRMEPLTFEDMKSKCHLSGDLNSCSECKKVLKDLDSFMCGHWSCKQCVSSDQSGSPAESLYPECGKKCQHNKDTGNTLLEKAKKNLREAMQKKFTLTFEGNGHQENLLQSIYTKLLITVGESEELHSEPEFRHHKRKLKTQSSRDYSVSLSDIFRPLPDQTKPHRTVLTKGVAGIGKSLAVQKFILDWAEEKENQDVDFVFSLAFRELNLNTTELSLHELLTLFHPTLCDFKDSVDYTKTKNVIILDGLDESRFQLDLENFKIVTSIMEITSVSNLLANLIQGNLLPDAKIWITSRPAAANQIPAKYIDMVTEIRGFTDPQKAEYFRKRFSHHLDLADTIISHIQSSQSLDIMCQTPIFCWISAVLFQEVFRENEKTETPQTLTEMMAHFLVVQTKCRNRKYDKKVETNKMNLLKTNRKFLLKFGKLAFDQLLKRNLVFHEEDLKACGLNIKEASIYSGFCTVVREENVFFQKKSFCFVHLTIQEFFAALYVYDCFVNHNTTELSSFLSLDEKEHTLTELLKMTVDKVLEKTNGHLDFFLRFLLGLMVEPNQRVLQGLLTPLDSKDAADKKILTYVKSIRRKTLSPDGSINLFQTMVEMRDHKVKDEIQDYLKLSAPSKTELTPLHCSALAYMLQVSKNDLDVLDLKSYNTSEEGRRRLIPAVKRSKRALLADCRVTEEWVEHLVIALKFPCSALRELDLTNNDLKDLGVKLLCDGLSSCSCRLETLRLSGCLVTEAGCTYLVSALQSNPSHLSELDLSYNHLGDSGEKQLSELRDDPQYKLSQLNVEHSGSQRMKAGLKKYAIELTLDPSTAHKNLLLSNGNRKVTWEQDKQPRPSHKEGSDHYQQVLCEQSLNGRCYWEVEVAGPLSVGVSFRRSETEVEADDSKMGHNTKSWCLVYSSDEYYILHSNKKEEVPSLGWRSGWVGVYVDRPAGTLSFYRVSHDSCIHLHTYKAAFNESLYPAVELHTQSSALFCQLV